MGLTFLAVIMALIEYNMMVAKVIHCKCRRVEDNTCDCGVETLKRLHKDGIDYKPCSLHSMLGDG